MNRPALWLAAVLLVVLLFLVFGPRTPESDPRPATPSDLSGVPAEPGLPPSDEPAPAPESAERALPPPPPGTVLYGRVTTESGAPVPGATVEVWDWLDVVDGPDLAHAESLLVPEAKFPVGDDGSYVLGRPSGTEQLVFTVRAPGYVPVTWEAEEIPVEPVAARVDVRLRPAGTISGRVVAPDGSPVVGAHVHAIEVAALREHQADDDFPADRPMIAARDLLWGDGRWDEEVHYRRTIAFTDSDGRFRMPDADPSQEYALLALAETHGLSALIPEVWPSTVDDGGPVELRLRKRAGIRLRIFDSGGRPVTDAKVKSTGSPRGRPELKVDEEGVWPHPSLDPGAQRLNIAVPGWPVFTHDVDLPPGETTETDAHMPGGGVVSGVVLDEGGQPISGARIQLQVEPEDDVLTDTVARIDTDAEGRFRIEGSPKGSGSMWITRVGYQEVVLRDLEVPVTGLRIHMRSAGTVRVEVNAPEGAERTQWISYAIRSVRPGYEPGTWSTDFTQWAGEEEPLEIGGVPTGGAEIRFWAHGCRLITVRAEVKEGTDCQLGSVRMLRAPRLVVIVVDQEGDPVVGARLGFDGDRHPPVAWLELAEVTDEDGRASIQFPVDEPQSMYVGVPGRKGTRHTVEPGDTPVRVRAGAPE